MTDNVETPELDKMREVHEQSQTIGEFLDTSEYVLARWVDCSREFHEGADISYGRCPEDHHLVEVHQTIEEVLAEYFGIDLEKVEAERQAILDVLRALP